MTTTVQSSPIISNPFSRIAFYGLRSPNRLADLLGVSRDTLERLASGGSDNYRQFEQNERWIETPKPELKKVQREIHLRLSRYEAPAYLFSGFKKRSAVGNAHIHLENSKTVMVKLDIRKFYPSSNGRLVYSFFHDDLHCSSEVASILWKLCTIKNTPNSQHSHLPTGGVTSPILAFFCYRALFEELAGLADQRNLTVSVMADDITFSGDGDGHEIRKLATQTIQSHGLRSNFKKQKVWGKNQNNKLVTGALVTPKGLRVPLSRKLAIKKLRAELETTKDTKKRAKLYQCLHGSLASAGQIEERFGVGARSILREWKNQVGVWREHIRMSGHRKNN
jgi:RNA-directed DNA polymerase